MKKIRVELTGESSLLMNSPKGMLEPKDAIATKTKKVDVKKEAESVCYRTDKGFLFVPNTAIKGCVIGASAYKKLGKYSLRPLIAGGMRLPEEELILKDKNGKALKDYEIDLRTVVIQRSRIVKARPKIKNWKLEFGISYNENMLPDPMVIKTVLEEGGERVGLLDFRPQKTGELGTFKVTKFEVQ